MDFAVPADHRVKLKISEKKDKYLELARKLKKLWDMKVTIIPIVIDALDTVTKGLIKGLEDLEITGRVETVQTTVLLRSASIEDCVDAIIPGHEEKKNKKTKNKERLIVAAYKRNKLRTNKRTINDKI